MGHQSTLRRVRARSFSTFVGHPSALSSKRHSDRSVSRDLSDVPASPEEGRSGMPPQRVAFIATLGSFLCHFMASRLECFANVEHLEVHGVGAPDVPLQEFFADCPVAIHEVDIRRPISPSRDIAALWELYSLFRRTRFDIIEASNPKAGLLAMVAGFLARVPTRIFFVRGLIHPTRKGPARVFIEMSEWLTCALSHSVLVNSPSVREYLIERWGLSRDRVTVIGHGSSKGVDAAVRFRPNPTLEESGLDLRRTLGIPRDAKIALTVGRLKEEKGIFDLLESWEQVSQEHEDAHLLLVGPEDWEKPSSSPRLQSYLEDLPRVRYLGKRSDIPSVLAASDLLVHPSHREGFPNAVLEASSMELPILGCNVLGTRDAVVDGKTGLLVPPACPEQLTPALSKLLSSESLRKRLGKAGRTQVLEHFDEDHILEEHVRYIHRVAQRRHLECTTPVTRAKAVLSKAASYASRAVPRVRKSRTT